MPKFTCQCDEVINLSLIPCPQEFRIIQDEVLERMVDALAALSEQTTSAHDFMVRAYVILGQTAGTLEAIECPNCGRLAVFVCGDPKVSSWYQREDMADSPKSQSLVSLVEQDVKSDKTDKD